VGALVVFCDANVLYPAELRNLLMHLALVGALRVHWSGAVHEEWIRNLLANRSDLTRAKLERTRSLMDKAAPDALVTAYEHRIARLHLPDPDDRHVLAAAIHCRAQAIVTRNLADFPPDVLAAFHIEALHPDALVMRLLETVTELVQEATENHRKSLNNPPKSVAEYLVALERQELKQSVAVLRRWTSPAAWPRLGRSR